MITTLSVPRIQLALAEVGGLRVIKKLARYKL